MNKLPTKQIYLLMVIIVGIIALSVYSTYAIFTFESETSEAFNIKLPSVLEIKTDMYEYKQIEIPENSVQTTDIDLYNTYDYELCYSIWYKVLNDDSSSIDIYELSDTGLSTNGTISSQTNSRFTLLIINNTDEKVKINLGLAAIKNTETCSLKLSSEKKNIKQTYDKDIINFKDEIIANMANSQIDKEDGSLIYKNKSIDLLYKDKVTIAQNYTIKNNQYQLIEPQEINAIDFKKQLKDLDYETQDYFVCSNSDCHTIYRINEANLKEIVTEDLTNPTYEYLITNIDEYEAYNKGPSGIKKINKDYYYYGDNPNNFIYYNCQSDELDSCELWRIIGLIYDETNQKYQIKLIRNDSLGNYQFNSNPESNIWNETTLYKYLTEEYSLDNKLMTPHPHILEEITNLDLHINDISSTQISTKNKEITLLNITDYLNTSTCQNGLISSFTDCLNNNWLNRITIPQEWTLTSYKEPIIESDISSLNPITPNDQTINDENSLNENNGSVNEVTDENISDNPDDSIIEDSESEVPTIEPIPEIIKKYMYSVGNDIKTSLVTDEIAVRPVVYLQERILLYSGEGTLDNPYIIK